MCYNCGCAIPFDDMGNPDNITADTFNELGKTLGKTPEETKSFVFQLLEKQKENQFTKIENEDKAITEMFETAAKAWGQSVADARQQTYNLLKYEVKKQQK